MTAEDPDVFSGLTYDEQVRRIEALGRDALRQLDVEPESMDSLVHAENTTFRVRAPQGEFCLRVCRPGYQSDENLTSELVFLGDLRRAGFAVPEPYVERVVKGTDAGVPEARNCVLFRWQDGEFAKGGFTIDHARAVGGYMAALHTFSALWQPPARFDRQRPLDRLREPVAFERPHEALGEAQERRFREALEETRAAVLSLEESPDRFGLIHADLHRGNVLFEAGAVRAIDFDDTGWSYWLADFAAALVYELGRPESPAIIKSMLEGYAEVRPLPPGTDELLPAFMRTRLIVVADWALRQTNNPRMRETAPKFLGDLMRLMDAIP